MAYELTTYTAIDPNRFETENDAVAAVFAHWPEAAVMFLVDEIDHVLHAVIWKDAESQARYDQPIGWVKPGETGFDRNKWRKDS